MGENCDLSIGVLRKIGIEIFKDRVEGHFLKKLEIALIDFELDRIEEGRFNIFDEVCLFFNQKYKILSSLLTIILWLANAREYFQTIQKPGQNPMLHFHYLYLHTSDTETFTYGLPLPMLNLFHEIRGPGPMYISVDIRYEVRVWMSEDIILCLGGKHKEGVIRIEDILAVRDDKGAGVRHEHVILFGNLLIKNYTQEQLVTVTEFLELLIVLTREVSVRLLQPGYRIGNEQNFIKELCASVESSNQ
jgi:hypothetical protein